MLYLIYTIHIVVCIFLILVVLLQQGKGADLSVFGGGSTQTVFGARGAATFLHKMTVFGFIAFTLTTISIGLLSGSATSSVFSDVEAPAAIEETVEDEAGTGPSAAFEEAVEAAESEAATADDDVPEAPAADTSDDGGGS